MSSFYTVQHKRGTTAQNDACVGKPGEITVDIERNELRLHDGLTPGGVIAQGGIGPKGEPGEDGEDGIDGESAYEIAKRVHGFQGDEPEWLEALKGDSAYEIAKRLDPSIGTEKEWLDSMKCKCDGTGEPPPEEPTPEPEPEPEPEPTPEPEPEYKPDGWLEITKLMDDLGESYDLFGQKVVMTQQKDMALIGAPGNTTKQGSVHVFKRNGDDWIFVEKITPLDGVDGDGFGASISLSADGQMAVIGAPKRHFDTGVAYVFSRSGDNWTEDQKIEDKFGSTSDHYGISVSISPEGNEIAVGAYRAMVGTRRRGSVYTYEFEEGEWVEKQVISSNTGGEDDHFGYSLVYAPNNIGLLIGCYRNRDYMTNERVGGVYFFTHNGAEWVQTQKMTSTDCEWMGWSVNVSADGLTAVFGARASNSSRGTAHIFELVDDVWTESQTLKASNEAITSWFGDSVTISHDGQVVMVGAYNARWDEDPTGNRVGATYVFDKQDGTWVEVQQLSAADGQEADGFGNSHAMDKEGRSVLVGAARHRSERGAVYYFVNLSDGGIDSGGSGGDSGGTPDALVKAPDDLNRYFTDGVDPDGNPIPDVTNWDTSHVTDMSWTFNKAETFNQDISGWNTSKVTTIAYMFFGASSFNQNIGGWDTSQVTDMRSTFNSAVAFNQDLSGWNTSKVTTMDYLFHNTPLFNHDITNWDTSSVTSMTDTFGYAANFNQDISGWDTSNVVSMRYMFRDAETFDQNLGDLNISSVNDMYGMFDNSGMSVANYDKTLNGWYTQALAGGVQNNVKLRATGIKHSSVSADARQALINDYGWTIEDAGSTTT